MEDVFVEIHDVLHRLGAAANDVGVLKRTKQQTAFLPTLPLEPAEGLLSCRLGMRVTKVMVFDSPVYGKTGYDVCPRCKISMEREFLSFCDRCGQHLDWKDYRKAKIVYPGKGQNEE